MTSISSSRAHREARTAQPGPTRPGRAARTIRTRTTRITPRRAVRVGALVLASFGAVTSMTMIDGGTVSADSALADEVTSSARDAVTALDVFRMTGEPRDADILAWHRATTAMYAAHQLGYDAAEMQDAWAAADLDHQRAILAALTQVGVPYRTNASSEGVGFDCSGLTSWAWGQAGVEIYHQSGTQISEARRIERDAAQPGDLVHYPGHVMMYLGVGEAIVHSPHTGATVEIDTLSRDSVSFGDPTG